MYRNYYMLYTHFLPGQERGYDSNLAEAIKVHQIIGFYYDGKSII